MTPAACVALCLDAAPDFPLPGGPVVYRNDPAADREAALWCCRDRDVAACVFSASGGWFAALVRTALRHGQDSDATPQQAALHAVVRAEIGAEGCDSLLDDLERGDRAVDARRYPTRTRCSHGHLLPHLVRSYLNQIGEAADACSGLHDAVMLRERVWSPSEAAARLHELLPFRADDRVELSVIRMPDHRDAVAAAMPLVSVPAPDAAIYAAARKAVLDAAVPMHRPLLEFVFAAAPV